MGVTERVKMFPSLLTNMSDEEVRSKHEKTRSESELFVVSNGFI
jgi:hypothetical protein